MSTRPGTGSGSGRGARVATFRENAATTCLPATRRAGGPGADRASGSDKVWDETFGQRAFFLGPTDPLVAKDPRFTNAACLTEEEIAEYETRTGDRSVSAGHEGDYGGGGYADYDGYPAPTEYRTDDLIYARAQYEADMEAGRNTCAAPEGWGDEPVGDFEVAQAGLETPDAEPGAEAQKPEAESTEERGFFDSVTRWLKSEEPSAAAVEPEPEPQKPATTVTPQVAAAPAP